MHSLVLRGIIKKQKKIVVSEVLNLKVSYKKLWVMLAEREMTNVELRRLTGIAPATFSADDNVYFIAGGYTAGLGIH